MASLCPLYIPLPRLGCCDFPAYYRLPLGCRIAGGWHPTPGRCRSNNSWMLLCEDARHYHWHKGPQDNPCPGDGGRRCQNSPWQARCGFFGPRGRVPHCHHWGMSAMLRSLTFFGFPIWRPQRCVFSPEDCRRV